MTYLEELISAIQFSGELFPANKPVNSAGADGIKQFFENFTTQPEYDPLFQPGGVIHSTALRFIESYPQPIATSGLEATQAFLKEIQQKVFGAGFWVGLTVGDVVFNGKPIYGTSQASLKADVEQGNTKNFHAWLTFGNLEIMDLSVISMLLDNKVARPADFKDKRLLSTKPRKTAKLQHKPIVVANDFLNKR